MLTLNTSTVTLVPPPPKGERRPLLTPVPGYPHHYLLVLDNTSLEKWKRCQTAAYHYLVLRREAHAKNAALTFGGALHEGLDLYHRQQWARPEPGTEEYNALSPASQDAAIRNYFLSNPPPPDEYRTVENALRVMSAYRQHNEFDPTYKWDILADEHGPLIERAFELPLGVIEMDTRFRLCGGITCDPSDLDWSPDQTEAGLYVHSVHVAWSGRMDVIAHANGRNRICDHKTTSIDGDQFVQSFQLASQTLGYTWAASQLWPELDISGFCLNAIRFKKPNAGTSDLLARGARGGEPPLKFFRAYFDYPAERIAEWRDDTLTDIEDFLHCLVRGRFTHNDRHCFDKYGQCPYFSVCTFDNEETRMRFITSEAFREVTWNPVTKTTQ